MKRLFKIWGVIMMIMLVVGAFMPAAPAMAVYGAQAWQPQPLPSATGYTLAGGSDVTDIAQGPGILYAIDGTSATNAIYKSTDGGTSWTKAATSGIAAGFTLTGISVAPDNAMVVMVTTVSGNYSAWLSTDGASTWSALGLSLAANQTILDQAVGPARSATMLGRDYFIAVADATAGAALGNVYQMGAVTTWTTVFPAGHVN